MPRLTRVFILEPCQCRVLPCYATTSAPAGVVRPAEALRQRRWIRVGPQDSQAIVRLLSDPLYGGLQLGDARRQARDDPPVLPGFASRSWSSCRRRYSPGPQGSGCSGRPGRATGHSHVASTRRGCTSPPQDPSEALRRHPRASHGVCGLPIRDMVLCCVGCPGLPELSPVSRATHSHSPSPPLRVTPPHR
jgi:hypothetical protein